jgi:hypothetical protein
VAPEYIEPVGRAFILCGDAEGPRCWSLGIACKAQLLGGANIHHRQRLSNHRLMTQTHQRTATTKKTCKCMPFRKRLMGFEPSTFCMAISRSASPRRQECLQIGASGRVDRTLAFQELCADTGGLDNERTMSDAEGGRATRVGAGRVVSRSRGGAMDLLEVSDGGHCWISLGGASRCGSVRPARWRNPARTLPRASCPA